MRPGIHDLEIGIGSAHERLADIIEAMFHMLRVDMCARFLKEGGRLVGCEAPVRDSQFFQRGVVGDDDGVQAVELVEDGDVGDEGGDGGMVDEALADFRSREIRHFRKGGEAFGAGG